MRVLLREPGKVTKIKDIKGDLESLQSEIGGYIEFVYLKDLYDKGILVIVDDEGKLKGLDPNIAMVDDRGIVKDLLCGNVLFTGSVITTDGLSCDTLSDKQIDYLNKSIFNDSIKDKYSSKDGLLIYSVII